MLRGRSISNCTISMRTSHESSLRKKKYQRAKSVNEADRFCQNKGKKQIEGSTTKKNKVNSDLSIQSLQPNPEDIEHTPKYLLIREHYPVPLNRAKMIDWLLEVCAGLCLTWDVYWSALEILDILIDKFQYVNKGNIHIVGTTCLFMSEKFFEYKPISLVYFVEKALHNLFKAERLIKEERIIIQMIGNYSGKGVLNYSDSISNRMHRLFPELPKEHKLQVLRQLVIVWMDPVSCFKKIGYKEKSISYDCLISFIVKHVKQQSFYKKIQTIQKKYSRSYECHNIINLHNLKRIGLR